MTNRINLSEILKGHEGGKFYSQAYGTCELVEIHNRNGGRWMIKVRVRNGNCVNLTSTGRLNYSVEDIGECLLWPSETDRDWVKWCESHNKRKLIKIWNDLFSSSNKNLSVKIKIDWNNKAYFSGGSLIEKSSLAFIKIYQLIEEAYGGYPSATYSKFNPIYQIKVDNFKNIHIQSYEAGKNNLEPIRFKDLEKASEFIKYVENLELVKEFYI